MRIDRVMVKNFRNLAEVEVPLESGAVLVGENRVGKSNFMHALRLVLDPTLPNSERSLRREDFWDGLSDGTPGWDPMVAGEEIEVSVDFSDFEEEAEALTALSGALIEGDPMVARLTYRYSQSDRGGDGTRPVYEWRIFGRDCEDARVPADLGGYIWVTYLQALRDAQGDLGSRRRSPLRPLLEAAADAASEEELIEAAEAIKRAQAKIADLPPVMELAEAITDRTTSIVGEHHRLETELGVAPLEPVRLIRDLRLFVDGEAHRPLGSASLGTLNVLYLALLELDLEQRLGDAEIAHVLMAIEEPEAHLHPHLQRLVFSRLLRQEQPAQTVIVTTHSPHIASVADPRGLVVFRGSGDRTEVAAALEAELADEEWADIERYLDATRAEMVFARRVLLVEGFAEQVVLPVLADAEEIDLDKAGITVCAIHGTHFGSYIRFLDALQIRWAVITDGDPAAEGGSNGQRRAQRLLQGLRREGGPEEEGIFVGETTFEFDVFREAGNAEAFLEAMEETAPSKSMRREVGQWRDETPEQDDFMRVANRIGKGRLAQRLAQAKLQPPPYIGHALRYLVD